MACRVVGLWCRSLAVLFWGLVVSVPPSPLIWGCVFVCFFFRLRPSVVCVRVFRVSLLPVGRCSRFPVAGFGWVVLRWPFGGSRTGCGLAGTFGRFLWCGWAVWWLWAFLVLPAALVLFRGGGCLFVPPPSLGWCTHWSAFGVVFRVVVGACSFPGLAPAPWVGRAMSGSAALPAGLGAGSAGSVVAPGGFVWPWVRGLGPFASAVPV